MNKEKYAFTDVAVFGQQLASKEIGETKPQ